MKNNYQIIILIFIHIIQFEFIDHKFYTKKLYMKRRKKYVGDMTRIPASIVC